jgi:RHS repeat-associated protein
MRSVFISIVLIYLLIPSIAEGQYLKSVMNNGTPAALAPGAPDGSYAISNLEHIDPFGGSLNFTVPLVSVNGRGTARTTIPISISKSSWHLQAYMYAARCYLDNDCSSPIEYHSFTLNDERWYPEYSNNKVIGRIFVRVLQDDVTDCTSEDQTRIFAQSTETRLVYVESDGTEHELFSRANPYPASHTCYSFGNADRGRVFVSSDGFGAVFISDVDIYDYLEPTSTYFEAFGTLIFKDGTRIRFGPGEISLRDTNGNKIISNSDRTIITDTLGRKVIVSESGDKTTIIYRGFGGVDRIITVNRASISRNHSDLFPELNSFGVYNKKVVTSISLPDKRSFRFQYNPYGELVRVEMPSGSAIEYDYGPANAPLGGRFYASGTVSSLSEPVETTTPEMRGSLLDYVHIYRRILERRVYENGGSGSNYTLKTTYSRLTDPESYDPASKDTTFVCTVRHYDRQGLLSQEKHFYYGNPSPDSNYGWKNGREYRTQYLDRAGRVIRNEEMIWQQGGWRHGGSAFYDPSTDRGTATWTDEGYPQPLPDNPQIKERITTLVDTNQVTKKEYKYDQFNNVTDVFEYDFGVGSAGKLLRHTHTEYLKINPSNGVNYYLDEYHLTSLPRLVETRDSNGALIARQEILYDDPQYQENSYGQVLGWSDPGLARGNPTTVRLWVNTNNSYIVSHARYDQVGNVIETIDANGNRSSIEFAPQYHYAFATRTISTIPSSFSDARLSQQELQELRQTVSGQAFDTHSEYDLFTGSIVSTTDTNGNKTEFAYADILDRITSTIYPNGGRTTYQYGDTPGNLHLLIRSSLDQSRSIESYQYFDNAGRTIRSFSYIDGNRWTVSDTVYDSLGRVIKVSNPYETTSRTNQVPDAGQTWTHTEYDDIGRVKAVRTSDGAIVRTDYSGNEVIVTDQAGKARRTKTDALGRLIEVTEAPGLSNYGYVTKYTYDVLSNLTQVSQGEQKRHFVYDSLSRLTSATNPENGTVSYEYDRIGNLVSKLDARGVRINYTYDALNRIVLRRYEGPSEIVNRTPAVKYSYDGIGANGGQNLLGKLTSVNSSISSTFYDSYDEAGNIKASRQITNGTTYSMAYSYDLAGNLITQTYPSGRQVSTSINSAGRINSVSGNYASSSKIYASEIEYGPHGAIEALKLGNGLHEQIRFNSRLQPILMGLGTSKGDTSVWKLNYDYGTAQNNGNLLIQSITAPQLGTVTQTYNYDPLNRLESAQENNGNNWKQKFIYDRYGNRQIDVSNTSTGTIPETPQISQLTNRISSPGYSFDDAGNLKTSAIGLKLHYDAENKQVEAEKDGVVSRYFYDGDGRRVSKVADGNHTIFVYDAFGKLVGEYNSQNIDSGTNYITQDHLGSTRVVSNQQGEVISRHDYLPFGEELYTGIGGRSASQGYGPDTVRQKFTGYERDDETGLDYAQARYYSSLIGRFTSPDPLLSSGKPLQPQSWNRYSYVLNNPLKFVDPKGLIWGYQDFEQNGEKLRRYRWFEGNKVGKGFTKFTPAKEGSLITLADGGAARLFRSGIANVYPGPPKITISGQGNVNAAAGAFDGFVPFGKQIRDAVGLSGAVDTNSPEYNNAASITSIAQMAAGVLTGAGGVRAAGSLGDETITLYRAVSHAEFEDIMASGVFRAGPNSLGGKFFAESVDHAERWGMKLEGTDGFRIIDVRLPTVEANKLMRWNYDLDSIGPARYAELDQLKNAVIGVVK